MTLLLFMLAVVGVLLWLRTPIAFAFGFAVVAGAALFDVSLDAAYSSTYRGMESFGLVALPLFVYLGIIMDRGQLGELLVDYIETVLRRVASAVPLITVLSCAIFGAVSGAASGAIAAVGSVMIPRAQRRGYRRGYITGLVAASSVLTLLVPPSLPMLVFALSARLSIGAAFLTTVTPAALIVIGYTIISVRAGRARSEWVFESRTARLTPAVAGASTPSDRVLPAGSGGSPPDAGDATSPRWSREVLTGLPKVAPIALIPLAVLGGIYGGIASPTEAAALGVWVAVALALLVVRYMRPRAWVHATRDAAALTGALILMLFTIQMFSNIIVNEGLPFALADWMAAAGFERLTALVLLNVLLLLVGMLMDDVSGSVFAAALLLPIATRFGLEPLHFAAIVGVNLGIGNLTPPVAPLAFLAGGVAGGAGFREFGGPMARYLLLVNLPVLVAVTYLPDLVLWLPRTLGYTV